MTEKTYKTAGYSESDTLRVYPRTVCGSIRDGVSFEHDQGGVWVLSFSDLEEIYLDAKLAREER